MKRGSTEQKKEERRASIVERARAYIATRSFDEIRLNDLAHELDLVKGTLYLYFPTKQDLYASILVEGVSQGTGNRITGEGHDPRPQGPRPPGPTSCKSPHDN